MLYAPQQHQLVSRVFEPAPPKLSELSVWNSALKAACDFWLKVQRHSQISDAFKKMIAENELKLSLLSQMKVPGS
ncbi:MAG: hypothetical protein HQM15_02585 [Deltaproteobacteria bacterium]|nr:hypothetical protein [Deltaproteobacteria bacterium]